MSDDVFDPFADPGTMIDPASAGMLGDDAVELVRPESADMVEPTDAGMVDPERARTVSTPTSAPTPTDTP